MIAFTTLVIHLQLIIYFNGLVYGDSCYQTLQYNAIHNTSYSPVNFKNTDDINECYCKRKKCIRKCCEIDYSLDDKECVLNKNANFSVPNFNKAGELVKDTADLYHLVIGLMQCEEGYFSLYNNDIQKQFFVEKDGRLVIEDAEEKELPNKYCLDKTLLGEFIAIVCYPPEPISIRFNWIGMIISIPFLLATFLVYLIIPERNLHGKCLMCYVLTLCFSYSFLVSLQLETHYEDVPCIIMAVLCLFFFLVSFFWMNVMCIDIWWTFSGLRGFSGSRKEAEQKRFLLYSGYAWLGPLLIIGIVLLLRFGGFVEETSWFYPGIGHQQCWFSDDLQALIYFYTPLTLLVTINVVLFIVTAIKIQKVRQETAVLRKDESRKHSFENDKQRFNLYLKLLLAMGINWSMEIISFFCNWQGNMPQEIWYLTDFCNACYGVFIFFIFVFKKNIWLLLKKRYYMVIGKPYLARNLTQSTPRTATSTLSYANTNNTESTAMGS